MIYLKHFNESIIDELKDFCETSLAYLIDEGFEIVLSRIGISGISESYTQVDIYKKGFGIKLNDFNWESVQDHVVPFLQLLKKKYNLNCFKSYGVNRVVGFYCNDSVKVYSVEQLLSSQLPTRFPRRIKRIRVKVGDKL